MTTWSRGSEWHRWDPHLHTPGTLFNDGFGGDWDSFMRRLEEAQPRVAAVGITDYCVINAYREFTARRQTSSRLDHLRFVFPNVEFRLTVATDRRRGINLHLLFSPEDPNHVEEIERLLSQLTFRYQDRQYACSPADLTRLGQAYDPNQTDERGALICGAQQFKLETDQLRRLLEDAWMRNNCLLAVCANSGDGTAGLGKDDAFAALREELESLCHIVFSAQPSTRDYWLGKRDGHPRGAIERKYGNLKPCLHGSDAHSIDKVLRPDQDRYCWIRACPSFSGLKQVLLEPEARVCVASEHPVGPSRGETITTLHIQDATWMSQNSLELNDGLVAIIGPKGSGKTALADILAACAGSGISGSSSFLVKAQEHLKEARASVEWGDGTQTSDVILSGVDAESIEPHVRYLSQKFVERLCSSDDLADDLVREVEDVVFHAISEEDRIGATCFQDLRESRLDHVKSLRGDHASRVRELGRTIGTEETKIAGLAGRKKRLGDLKKEINTQEIALAGLLPKNQEQATKRLQELQRAWDSRSKEIQTVSAKIEKIDALQEELKQYRTKVSQLFTDLRSRYESCGLEEKEWDALRPQFDQAEQKALGEARERLLSARQALQLPKNRVEGDLGTWTVEQLRAELDSVAKQLGVEKNRSAQYKTRSKKLSELKQERVRVESEIADFTGAASRLKAAVSERRQAYARVFDTLVKEQETLKSLYEPLAKQLASESGEEKDIEFHVLRRVDVEGWVQAGEKLFDLRTRGAFQGRGSLLEAARESLVNAWRSGGSSEVADAMEGFLQKHARDLLAQARPDASREAIGSWLFATDHIEITYGIRFDGVDLSRLSPGMRGIVLLMLYLAIDEWDTRPLVIDQPEENLDPQSVYEQLVPYFRSAKRRRQVILVTHNANLVVNADADQVIVADSCRNKSAGLPTITYRSGGLEDAHIRNAVCSILEGGERAFLEREARYGLQRRRAAPSSSAE